MLEETLTSVRQYFEVCYRAAQVKQKGKSNGRVPVRYWLEQFGLHSGTVWGQNQADDHAYGLQYAWERTGSGKEPGWMVTIWIEIVEEKDGAWFYWDNLDPHTTAEGKPRDEEQANRTLERARILKHCYDNGLLFDALLLENEVTRDHLRKANKAASKIRASVRDEHQWHVSRWDDNEKRALLVRGPVNPGRMPSCSPDEPGRGAKLWFPDQAHRDAVEAAAVMAVRKEYEGRYDIRSREKEPVGYDLELFTKANGVLAYCFEVKGTSGSVPHFFITLNERDSAETEPKWRLVMVTDALSDEPNVLHPSRWDEVKEDFDLTALVWHATEKNL